MCAPPYSLFPDGWQNRLLFSLQSSSSRNFFILGNFNCHHLLGDSKGTSDPRGEEVFNWVISSDLLLNDPDTPTLLHCSSGSRSSPDISLLSPLLPFFAPGRNFRTWVLITNQLFYLSLSLRSTPTNVTLPSIFRKLAEMTLFPTLTPTVLLQRNTRLFPLLLLSFPL